ncbi:MAG: DNA-directed RNA polymerase subunit alpha [Nitrospirae bacterium]|nr:DNA-directed RNA polymerase subunit alpha [Nitrospirota bacterium]
MDLKKKGFQLPDKIRFEEETLTDTYGKLIAEPMEKGFGTTIGNSLRRVLLSSIQGAAVIGVKIKGVLHELSSISNVKEDAIDIILNIEKLRFRMSGNGKKKTALISVKGPKKVTGSDLQVDADVEVLNPQHLIATVDKGGSFEAELYIVNGKGYVPAELNKEAGLPVGVITVDSIFSPVTRVNFWVEKARVGRATDYDRLVMEIWTDSSITPKRAVSEAASVMSKHIDYFILEEEPGNIDVEPAQYYTVQDEPVFNENLLRTVEELELSVRAQNCLKNASIKTIADLVQKTEYDMLRTKNFGRKSLNEIKEILEDMGLRFGMRVDLNAIKGHGGKNAP